MVDINNLSRIGIGTYRMNLSNNEHYNALCFGIKSGYNLIDTASNYQNGKSEELIGRFIINNNDLSDKVFIISKFGYIPSSEKANSELSLFLNKNEIERAIIGPNFEYSLDPLFINHQLNSSLKKLNRNYLDAYLLHNPERYLESTNFNDKDKLYKSIKSSFELLEEKVMEGKIRYYGISSNKLFFPDNPDSIDLIKIIEIAKSISINHHFKFIQFPFNFKEQFANINTYKNKSLLEIAKANNIITISNRPININENGLEFRFVNYNEDFSNNDDIKDNEKLNDFYQQINKRLSIVLEKENINIDEYEPISFLKKHRNDFTSLKAVDIFFEDQLIPFLEMVFTENNHDFLKLTNQIRLIIQKKTKKNISNKANVLMKELKENGIIEEKSSYPLTAIHYYLNSIKINHILMGLRKKEYIENLNGEFSCDVS